MGGLGMLTLTRKVNESIRIGDDIEIVVKEIRRNHIRIGILAPKSVKIYRDEVYRSIQSGKERVPDEEDGDSAA
jgi:carbon storage regulator